MSSDQPALVVNGDVTTLTFPTDDYALDFRGICMNKSGGLYAEVTARHGEQNLHVARFDLLNQREQELFHQRCVSVNSNVADWQSRLQVALPRLRELAASPGDQGTKDPGAVWQRAISAVDFVNQEEDEHQSLTADLVYPGAITDIAAPRGTGKSIVALILAVAEVTGGLFRGERLRPVQVLYVDRDNPPRLIRDRLRRIGVEGAANLRLITRLDAPPLTNKQAWLALPWQDYDVVIIDSIGAATEGVSEKEGRETQHFLATLKDLAQRGLALVALDNTIKAGTNYRGRGEKADAVDILYEARDITNWTPTQDNWWLDLPEAGDHTWASRASRHRHKTHMRIAFVASKFRLGMDPAPFTVEIDFRGDCWTLRDITAELVQAGEEARDITRKAKQDLFRQATEVLVTAISQRSKTNPMTKTEAERSLMDQGLRRQEARNLLEAQNGCHWQLTVWVSQRGRPTIVVPLGPSGEEPDGGEKDHPQNTCTNTSDGQLQFPPCASPADGENQPSSDPHASIASAHPISANRQTSGRRKSTHDIPSNDASKNGAVFYAASKNLSSAPGADGND
jgi:AAA domain